MPAPFDGSHLWNCSKYVHQKLRDIKTSTLPYLLLESMGQEMD